MKKIKCGCGCGKEFDEQDKYGRTRRFVSGHNRRKYYDDPTQSKRAYKREWRRRNRKRRQEYKTKYTRNRKRRLLKLRGGKCVKCGIIYDGTNGAIFDMHHRNPKTKKFLLGQVMLVNIAWAKIVKEAKKCDVLCSNCHRLLHSEAF